MGLVGHAAAQPNDEAGLFLFKALERTYVAKDPLLRMLAHSASVEQDQVGLLRRIAQAISNIGENALDALSIVDVLLTAVAMDIGQRRCIIHLAYQCSGSGIVFKCNVFQ